VKDACGTVPLPSLTRTFTWPIHRLRAGYSLAQRRPDLVRSLVLIAPFCRPTPQPAILLLRLTVAPGIGGAFSKHVLYRFTGYFGGRVMRAAHHTILFRILGRFSLPTRGESAVAADDDRRALQFNADMAAIGAEPVTCATNAIYGKEDAVLDPHWHLDWLIARVPRVKIRLVPAVGQNPHHAAPALVARYCKKPQRPEKCVRAPNSRRLPHLFYAHRNRDRFPLIHRQAQGQSGWRCRQKSAGSFLL
jgi:hypothetical protein